MMPSSLGLRGSSRNGCTSVRAAFSLIERGETRREPESSQRTVPPQLSCPGERDMHNNTPVPSTVHARMNINYKRQWRTDRISKEHDN